MKVEIESEKGGSEGHLPLCCLLCLLPVFLLGLNVSFCLGSHAKKYAETMSSIICIQFCVCFTSASHRATVFCSPFSVPCSQCTVHSSLWPRAWSRACLSAFVVALCRWSLCLPAVSGTHRHSLTLAHNALLTLI